MTLLVMLLENLVEELIMRIANTIGEIKVIQHSVCLVETNNTGMLFSFNVATQKQVRRSRFNS